MVVPLQPPEPSHMSFLVLLLPSLHVFNGLLFTTVQPEPLGVDEASHWPGVHS